jgi:hypothetical protein
MRNRLGMSSALVLLFGACQAGGPAFIAQDEAALRGAFDSTVTWVNAKQWDKWAGQFAENGVLQPPNAPAVSGRAAILAWGQAFPEIQSLSFSNVVAGGEGNLGYGTSSYAIQVKDLPPDTGKQLVVFQRRGGKWEIVAVSFNSDLPLPAAPPPPAPQP